MGGFYQTDKMRKHGEQCAACKIAHLAPGRPSLRIRPEEKVS